MNFDYFSLRPKGPIQEPWRDVYPFSLTVYKFESLVRRSCLGRGRDTQLQSSIVWTTTHSRKTVRLVVSTFCGTKTETRNEQKSLPRGGFRSSWPKKPSASDVPGTSLATSFHSNCTNLYKSRTYIWSSFYKWDKQNYGVSKPRALRSLMFSENGSVVKLLNQSLFSRRTNWSDLNLSYKGYIIVQTE